jgi:hypothetical protein
MNGKSRREYLAVIYARYRRADLREKQGILSEFCRNTGYNREIRYPSAERSFAQPQAGGPSTAAPLGELHSKP